MQISKIQCVGELVMYLYHFLISLVFRNGGFQAMCGGASMFPMGVTEPSGHTRREV